MSSPKRREGTDGYPLGIVPVGIERRVLCRRRGVAGVGM
jgi:hypothetical protein